MLWAFSNINDDISLKKILWFTPKANLSHVVVQPCGVKHGNAGMYLDIALTAQFLLLNLKRSNFKKIFILTHEMFNIFIWSASKFSF